MLAIAESDPVIMVKKHGDYDPQCFYCKASYELHLPQCLWLRARRACVMRPTTKIVGF